MLNGNYFSNDEYICPKQTTATADMIFIFIL